MRDVGRSRGRRAATAAALAAAMALLAASADAQAFGAARKGIGIGIGSGTIANGLSLKPMAGPGALQIVVGLWGGGGSKDRFGHPGGIAGSVDYLFEMPTLARSDYFTVDWSFGLGGGLGVPNFDTRLAVAGAGIAGLEFNFTRIPLDVTIEYRPTLRIVPDPKLGLIDFTAHVRLWF